MLRWFKVGLWFWLGCCVGFLAMAIVLLGTRAARSQNDQCKQEVPAQIPNARETVALHCTIQVLDEKLMEAVDRATKAETALRELQARFETLDFERKLAIDKETDATVRVRMAQAEMLRLEGKVDRQKLTSEWWTKYAVGAAAKTAYWRRYVDAIDAVAKRHRGVFLSR